jgi:hypothetical protein
MPARQRTNLNCDEFLGGREGCGSLEDFQCFLQSRHIAASPVNDYYQESLFIETQTLDVFPNKLILNRMRIGRRTTIAAILPQIIP